MSGADGLLTYKATARDPPTSQVQLFGEIGVITLDDGGSICIDNMLPDATPNGPTNYGFTFLDAYGGRC